MMKISLLAAIFGLAVFMEAGQAKPEGIRLVLKPEGGGDATLTLVNMSPEAKLVGEGNAGITVDQPVTSDWSALSVTFRASADTTLRLRLSASWSKEEDKWVLIDSVKGEGVEISNPDFETPGPKAPAGWKFLQDGPGQAAHVHDGGAAASGEWSVKVSHGCPVVQTIRVPKDVDVTISLSGKIAPAE